VGSGSESGCEGVVEGEDGRGSEEEGRGGRFVSVAVFFAGEDGDWSGREEVRNGFGMAVEKDEI
jgi:hypothetical protein